MSQQVVDSENVIDSIDSAPDKLRAEIGNYYRLQDQSYLVAASFSTGRIKSSNIVEGTVNDQVLIPIKRATITIEGEERFFRDHIQWNNYISEAIVEGRQYLDHTFSLTAPTVTNQFIKNQIRECVPDKISSN